MRFSKVSAIALALIFPFFPTDLPGLPNPAAIAQTSAPPTDRRTQALYQILRADWFISVGLPETGEASREEGLQTLLELGDRLTAAEILVSIGDTQHRSGNLQEALVYYQRALEIYQGRIVSPIDRYQQLYQAHETAINIGSVYQALGQYEQAMAAYEQAIAIARRTNTPFTPPDGFVKLGTLYQLRGQPEQALAAYQQALPYHQEIRAYSTRFYNQLGLLYQSQGQFDLALAAYQEGLAALEERDANLWRLIDRVLTLENISEFYRTQGQTAQAETYAQQAIDASLGPTGYRDHFGEGPDEEQRAQILQDIGSFYLEEGQIDRAKSYFDRAWEIMRDSSNYYAQLDILRGIEMSYQKLGQLEQTIPYRQQAVEIYRANGLLLEASESLRSLAGTYQRLEQWEVALSTYQQAIASFESFHEELASFYDVIDTPNSSNDFIRFQMGVIYQAQGKTEEALTNYQQVLAFAQETSDQNLQARVLQQMGKLYEAQGLADQAQQAYQQATAIREQILAEIQNLPMPTIYR